jgi:hypothetical protein
MYEKSTDLKKVNNNLKVLIAVGGLVFSLLYVLICLTKQFNKK